MRRLIQPQKKGGRETAPRVFALGPFVGSLALLAVLFACGEREDSKTAAAPPEPRGEWFWRDRLAQRPAPLDDPAQQPEIVEAAAGAFAAAAGRPPASLEPEIDLLTRLGAGAVPIIRNHIRNPDPAVRFLAAAALGRIGGPHVQEPLLLMLRDEWSTVAILAADCLVQAAETWTVPRLIKAVGPYPVDFNPYLMVRVKAARALIARGVFSGVPFLIKILKENTPAEDPSREWDEDQRMAWYKEEALAELAALAGDRFGFAVDAPRPAQAEAALRFERWWMDNRIRLWDSSPQVRDPLLVREVEALVVDGLPAFQIRNKDSAYYILQMMGPPVFPFLERALERDDFYIRFHALGIIADIAPLAGPRRDRWADAVGDCLQDLNPALRAQACRTLGFIGSEGSVPLLEAALADPDADARLKAVEALGRVCGTQSRRSLEGLLATVPEGQLRVEVLGALVRCAGTHAAELTAFLLAEDLARQEWALQKIIDLTGRDFGFPLGGPAEVRREAAETIAAELRELYPAAGADR